MLLKFEIRTFPQSPATPTEIWAIPENAEGDWEGLKLCLVPAEVSPHWARNIVEGLKIVAAGPGSSPNSHACTPELSDADMDGTAVGEFAKALVAHSPAIFPPEAYPQIVAAYVSAVFTSPVVLRTPPLPERPLDSRGAKVFEGSPDRPETPRGGSPSW